MGKKESNPPPPVEAVRPKPSPAPLGKACTDWRKIVFRVLIAKMKKETENGKHEIQDKDRIEFQLY